MLFPPEIIQFSSENHFVKHNKSFVGIYICIVILLVGVFACLPLIKVTVSIVSPGIIRTASENSDIRTSTSGRIVSSNIREGKTVCKGDTLVILWSESLHVKINLLAQQRSTNQTFISDLQTLTKGGTIYLSHKYLLEKYQYDANIEKLCIDVKIHKQEYDLQKQLYEKKVNSKNDFINAKNLYDLSLSKMKILKKQSLNLWENELSKLILENQSIESSILQLKKDLNQFIITAPISGSIQQVTGIQEGSFIVSGQILATISPNESLLVECYVRPSEIGYLKIAQSAIIQVSTFNFHQWGSIPSKIMQISDDIVFVENQPFFKVRCQLSKNYLTLKSGQKGKLKKGMTSTCRFILTKRTLLQLLFDKIENWINPNIISET